jgi:hypothetical protein
MSHVAEREALVTLVCVDCAGSWPRNWIKRWSFSECPRCAGELRLDRHRTLGARARQADTPERGR